MANAPTTERETTGPADETPEGRRATDLESKRKRFEDAGRFPVRKVVIAGVAICVVVFGGIAAYSQVQESKEAGGPTVAGATVATQSGPSGQNIIHATQDAQSLTFPVEAVKKGIVQINYTRTAPLSPDYQQLMGGNTLPLLAYVAPSGKIVVASSLCEPCRGTSFHIDNGKLVCDKCFTSWDLNTLQGVSGACQSFPPVQMRNQLTDDGNVSVDVAQLEAWTPRAY